MNTLIESSIQLKCLLAILALLSALAYAIAMMLKSFSHQAPYKNIYDLTLGAMLVAFLASYFLLMDPYLASEEAVQTTAEILLYGSALPLPFTFWAFYKERKWPYLLDAVALVFLWPCLIFSKPFLFPYFFSAFYLFLRAILLAFVSFRTIKNSLNRYTIKAVLDTLPWGLLIARKDGRPAYINDAFKLILAEWNISPHQKLAEIEQALRQQAAFSLASDSVIIPFYGAYLLLKKNTEGSWISLSFHVVTEEVLLNEEIRQTNATLQAEKLTLEKTLDELKSLAHGKEKSGCGRSSTIPSPTRSPSSTRS
jgi:hypothetical protein